MSLKDKLSKKLGQAHILLSIKESKEKFKQSNHARILRVTKRIGAIRKHINENDPEVALLVARLQSNVNFVKGKLLHFETLEVSHRLDLIEQDLERLEAMKK